MNGDKISLNVNGKELSGLEGQNVLQVLIAHSIDIPHVCFQPNLGPINKCDACLVKIDGKVVRSCSTPASNGMNVDYSSKDIRDLQEEALQKILKNHELYCTVCENNNGDCDLHNSVQMMGLNRQKYEFRKKPYEVDDTNPFYRYDPNQCILCGRCVEACQNVQVNETLSIDWSREVPRVIWDNDVPINDSSCVSCGHCVTVCPVNALMEKPMLGKAGYLTSTEPKLKRVMIDFVKSFEPEIGMKPVMALSNAESILRKSQIKKTKTVCTYCGVGCSFEMWTKGRDILKIQPSPESPANGISTCIKGKFGWGFVNSPERLTTPLIREGDHFRKASWDEALDLVAAKLSDLKEKYGGDSIEFIASSKGTCEEAYLLQKMARQIFGTNNVDNSSRFCQAPATTGLWRTVGYGGDAGSIHDIYISDLVMGVGTNTAESHPVLATRVKRAHKLNGQKLIVSDIRKHEMAQRADIFMHPKPGTDLVWLSAVTKYIIDQKWHDESFIKNRVNGLDSYYKSIERFTLDFAEQTTGIPKQTLIDVAKMIHEAKSVCILWAMGVTQHQMGSDTSTAISNLLLVTGNYGRPGTGAYPLRGHNNVQGASDFGAMNAYLPGYQKVSDNSVRKKFEKAWKCKIPSKPGFDNNSCLEAIEDGYIKGMYVVGEELVETGSSSNFIKAKLEQLEFLVVQELFKSETAKFADVILPSSVSLEKEGTFVNTERRIQRIYKVMDPLPGTRPDWEIFKDLATKMGYKWDYSHPSEIMEEAASLVPIFAGVSYDLLEGFGSQQWPVRNRDGGESLLYTERFNFPDGKGNLYPLEWAPKFDIEGEFDLHMNNGRLLEHFHEGNETYKTEGIREKVPTAFLEISPELSKERDIKTGDLVRITSKWGHVEVKVLVTDRVAGKELYLPMNSTGDQAINLLTSRVRDPVAGTPAYKEVSVRIEKLSDGKGVSPLPRTNPRNGNPKPQKGVMVEKKWSREDYKPLTSE